MGGLDSFQKLGVEIEFVTFKVLVNRYMSQWTGKDENYNRRANFWLTAFNDAPIKSIKPGQIEKVLNEYATGSMKEYR